MTNFTKIAVIPARGGSTRLKNKNMYPLNGIPLIRWITETVINSQGFDKVIVSTDDDIYLHDPASLILKQ